MSTPTPTINLTLQNANTVNNIDVRMPSRTILPCRPSRAVHCNHDSVICSSPFTTVNVTHLTVGGPKVAKIQKKYLIIYDKKRRYNSFVCLLFIYN